jgi:transcription antitermination protein NusB
MPLGRRHQARQLALKVLFELEGGQPAQAEEPLRYQLAEAGLARHPEVAAFARDLVMGVLSHEEALNREIRQASKNWELEQMAKMDRIILRIAIYEIAIARQVPMKAAINESIELAKEFSGEDSSRFVNGILGKIAAQRSAAAEQR